MEKAWMEDWKAGQVPVWLDTEADQDRVQWHFHSEIFRLPADDGVLDPRVEETFKSEKVWKGLATPSFSSFPIEGRIGWVHDLNENL
jgi:3-O-alpha-D-mannopyranosyl-alpha-D-mannopyranose xylosylphosphotransferase